MEDRDIEIEKKKSCQPKKDPRELILYPDQRAEKSIIVY